MKMDEAERKEVQADFKSVRFISTIGFLTLGCFIAMLGNALDFMVLNWIGVPLLAVGGICAAMDMWRKDDKWRSVYIFILTIIIVVVFSI